MFSGGRVLEMTHISIEILSISSLVLVKLPQLQNKTTFLFTIFKSRLILPEEKKEIKPFSSREHEFLKLPSERCVLTSGILYICCTFGMDIG